MFDAPFWEHPMTTGTRCSIAACATTGHDTDEAHWQERPSLARTESPRYLGRAVAALAVDPAVLDKSGAVHRVADLALEYGFTDIDGRRVPAFELDND